MAARDTLNQDSNHLGICIPCITTGRPWLKIPNSACCLRLCISSERGSGKLPPPRQGKSWELCQASTWCRPSQLDTTCPVGSPETWERFGTCCHAPAQSDFGGRGVLPFALVRPQAGLNFGEFLGVFFLCGPYYFTCSTVKNKKNVLALARPQAVTSSANF